MQEEAAEPKPGAVSVGPTLRESLLFALCFWLITYGTLTVWALVVAEGVATPISVRRLITTGAGSLFYWLTIRLHAALRQRPAPFRIGVVLGTAAIACLLLFAIRLTIYRLMGGTTGAEIGNNVQWLLLWAGYFLAGIGIYVSTSFARALRAADGKAEAAAEGAPAEAAQAVFWVERAGASQRVATREIEWFGAEGNYVRLHGRDGAPIGLMRGTLAGIESQLDANEFVRVHRSAICRVETIRALRRLPSGATVARLDSGGEVPVGRRFRPTVDRLIGRA